MKGNQINWNQVYYFCAIALQGSLKNAAAGLGLSPSTLSEHLSQLEKDLDVVLFRREHRQLTLTAPGARLFQHARPLFETGHRLLDVVSPLPLGCYPISVGMVAGPSLPLVHDVLSKYLAKYEIPNLRTAFCDQEALEKGLSDARFDFGFSDRLPTRQDFVATKLFSSRLQFYSSIEAKRERFAEALSNKPLLYGGGDAGVKRIRLFLEDLDIAPKGFIQSEAPLMLYELCASGNGIGIFCERAVRDHKLRLRKLRIPDRAVSPSDDLYLLWSSEGENTEAVKRLKEILSPGQRFAKKEKSREINL